MGRSYFNSYNDDIELGIWVEVALMYSSNDDIELGIWVEGTLIAVIMALRWEGGVLYPF